MSESQETGTRRQIKPNRFRITSIIAIAIVALFLISSFSPMPHQPEASPSMSQPTQNASVQTLSSTGTKFFNLTFIENHNFTNGAGNWTNRVNTWLCKGGEFYSEVSTSSESAIDPTKPFYDGMVTFDYRQVKNPSYPNDIPSDFLVRWNGLAYGSGANGYAMTMASAKFLDASYSYAELFKWYGGSSKDNYYYPAAHYSSHVRPNIQTGQIFSQVYNSTWMRLTMYVVGNDISCSWSNISMETTAPTWRISILDSASVAGTDVIPSGLIGLRSYRANTSVKQILYDYPYFPISIRAGQSINVHLTSNYTGGVISGTPSKGTLQNGWWNFTSSTSDIGIWNHTFTMTNATKTVEKQIRLAIFPDLTKTTDEVFYSGNPVIANAPGNTSQQLFDPTIIKDVDGKYKMWVSVNQPAPYSGLAINFYESTDCINWVTNGWTNPLSSIPLGYNKPAVVKNGSYYEMLIGITISLGSGIYHFRSLNGYDWTIANDGDPVIVHSGWWDQGWIQSPSLNLVDGIYYVTYAGGAAAGMGISEPRSFSVATGSSLEVLTKTTNIPATIDPGTARGNLSISFGSAKPVRYANCWLAIVNGFDPLQYSHATIAMSLDLQTWNYYPDLSAFPLNVQSWQSAYLYTGAVLSDDNGALGFWMNGRNATNYEAIGFMAYIPSELAGHYMFGKAYEVTPPASLYDETVTSFGKGLGPAFSVFNTQVNMGAVNITMTDWFGLSGTNDYAGWTADAGTGSHVVNFTLSSLESGGIYRLFIDGERISTLTASGAGTISFTYSGPWTEHQFEIEYTGISGSVGSLVDLILLFFALGVVIMPLMWVVKLTKLKKPPTIDQVINVLVFIIVGLAAVGVVYTMI